MSNQIKHRKLGHEPLVGLYYVAECIKCGWIGSSGELTEDDAQCLQPVGDDHCWGDTDEIDAERLLELLQAGAFDKPAAQQQDEPIKLSDDVREFLQEWIDSSTGGEDADIDYGFANQLGLLLGPIYAELPAPVASVPEGYCIMPSGLTAENGAKALLLGEFTLKVTMDCSECCELEEPSEGCEICDGEGEYGQKHTIPWDQIKFIYSKAVEGLAK